MSINIISLLEDNEKYELVFEDGKLNVGKQLLNENCSFFHARSNGVFIDKNDNIINLEQFPKRYFTYLFSYLINDTIPSKFVELLEFVNICLYLGVKDFSNKIRSRIPTIEQEDIYMGIEKYSNLLFNDGVFNIFINELISAMPMATTKMTDILAKYKYSCVHIPVSFDSLSLICTKLIKGACIGHDGYCCLHPRKSDTNIISPTIQPLCKKCQQRYDVKS